jgi:3-oxoacyl-ACP reductase-like protein
LALGVAAAATGAVVAGASAAIAKGEARTDEKIAAQRGRRVRGDMG